MLIFTGMSVESDSHGTRHMLLLASPRAPGVHYKVETDAGTTKRLREIIEVEIGNCQEHCTGSDDIEDDLRDPARRF